MGYLADESLKRNLANEKFASLLVSANFTFRASESLLEACSRDPVSVEMQQLIKVNEEHNSVVPGDRDCPPSLTEIGDEQLEWLGLPSRERLNMCHLKKTG